MYVLGINAFHADASVALLEDGELVVALEEERFRRVKHWAGFPSVSIQKALDFAGIKGKDLAHIAIGRDPRAHLMRKLRFLATHRTGLNFIRGRLRHRSSVLDVRGPLASALGLEKEGLPELHFVEHHPAHLASTFFVSPFSEAAVASIDGLGDFVSTSVGVGRGSSIETLDRVFFPHSLGLLYEAMTQFLGFRNYGDEFKVMGLAPYGEPRFARQIRQMIHLEPGGGFRLELPYFLHWRSTVSRQWTEGYPERAEIFSPRIAELLDVPARDPKAPVEKVHEDVAASLQAVFEEVTFHILNGLWEKTRLPNLCMSGGCAMNSVANGKIRERTPFQNVFIQPASGDNGVSLGAAYQVWNQLLQKPRSFVQGHSYWGQDHGHVDGEALLQKAGRDTRGLDVTVAQSEEELVALTADLLAQGMVVGWYQGRMEWGARALGNRSILADPRRTDMRDLINTKIKFREKFRPFAPSVAEEALDRFFVGASPDPFMVTVFPVREEARTEIPAVTHVDGSGRVQTVSEEVNSLYYRLIKAFEARTGVPILLNTSFNENEPIVDTPEQALDCFLRTRMDVIALGRTLIRRTESAIPLEPTRTDAPMGAAPSGGAGE